MRRVKRVSYTCYCAQYLPQGKIRSYENNQYASTPFSRSLYGMALPVFHFAHQENYNIHIFPSKPTHAKLFCVYVTEFSIFFRIFSSIFLQAFSLLLRFSGVRTVGHNHLVFQVNLPRCQTLTCRKANYSDFLCL